MVSGETSREETEMSVSMHQLFIPRASAPLCGLETDGSDALCAYHILGEHDDWAASNRIMCDVIHREIMHHCDSYDTHEC
jgi:hypothetical protein